MFPVTQGDRLHAQTLGLKLCWNSLTLVGCCLGVLNLCHSLGLSRWAFDGLMVPVVDLGAAWQGIIWASPQPSHLCGCAGLWGFFHRTWHFPHNLIPSLNSLNEYSTVQLLKQIPAKESACQPGNLQGTQQQIHYVKKMCKWFPVNCQDSHSQLKILARKHERRDMEQMFLLIFLWQLKKVEFCCHCELLRD